MLAHLLRHHYRCGRYRFQLPGWSNRTQCVANNSLLLRLFFEVVLHGRKSAEMDSVTRYTLRLDAASIMKRVGMKRFDVVVTIDRFH